MLLLAQEAQPLWEEIIKGLAGNGLWLFLSVVMLLWSIETVSRQFFKHRERMAMIESGIHPDRPTDTAQVEAPRSETLDLRKSG